MSAVRYRAVMLVNICDELVNVQRELAISFDRPDIVWPRIIWFGCASVITVGLYNDHIMCCDIIPDIITIVIICRIVPGIPVCSFAKIPLSPTVQEIDDWIFLICFIITGWQKNPVIPDLAKCIAVMDAVYNC